MTPLRALLSWLLLLLVAVANGALRQFGYAPALGDRAARQISTGLGAVLVGIAIWLLLRRWPPARPSHAWAIGALWASMTVLFEAGMVRGSGRPWGEVLAQYALWRGSLWPLLVLWVLVAPPLLARTARRDDLGGPRTP